MIPVCCIYLLILLQLEHFYRYVESFKTWLSQPFHWWTHFLHTNSFHKPVKLEMCRQTLDSNTKCQTETWLSAASHMYCHVQVLVECVYIGCVLSFYLFRISFFVYPCWKIKPHVPDFSSYYPEPSAEFVELPSSFLSMHWMCFGCQFPQLGQEITEGSGDWRSAFLFMGLKACGMTGITNVVFLPSVCIKEQQLTVFSVSLA